MSFDLKDTPNQYLKNESAKFIGDHSVSNGNSTENRMLDEPESDGNLGTVLHTWQAPEYEVYEKSVRWYLVAGIFIAIIVAYALATNGPIMAITFILIGIVGYLHLQKDPRIITFAITSKGVLADQKFYLFDNIFSFWIFYQPHHTKTISLHTKASMLPYIHLPLEDEDPVALRELLIKNIPEIKQDASLIDALERFLHI